MKNTNKENNCGRPTGRRKTAKIEISIEPEIKNEFMEICYEEGVTASNRIYGYIREYIKLHKMEEKRI